MALQPSTISKGFILAGLMNMSVLIFSKLFSNEVIPQYDPEVMSQFGLIMIIIWGLAYMSIAKSYTHVRWLIGVFALEKLCYGIVWIRWMLSNNISEVFANDAMAGVFYATYGVNDWLFFIFFLMVFIRLGKREG